MEIIARYLTEVADAIRAMPAADIEKAVDILFEAWRRERTAYIIGNGGSAATGSHMMNDLTKLARVPGHRPLRALALTDNVPLMTAWANDEEFANIFVRQLETFLRPSDVVLAISTSGNSSNIVRAVEFARDRGAATLGFAGRHGGRMRAIVDVCVCVPSDDIGQQEDAHLALSHVMSYAIRERVRAHAGKASEVLI